MNKSVLNRSLYEDKRINWHGDETVGKTHRRLFLNSPEANK